MKPLGNSKHIVKMIILILEDISKEIYDPVSMERFDAINDAIEHLEEFMSYRIPRKPKETK